MVGRIPKDRLIGGHTTGGRSFGPWRPATCAHGRGRWQHPKLIIGSCSSGSRCGFAIRHCFLPRGGGGDVTGGRFVGRFGHGKPGRFPETVGACGAWSRSAGYGRGGLCAFGPGRVVCDKKSLGKIVCFSRGMGPSSAAGRRGWELGVGSERSWLHLPAPMWCRATHVRRGTGGRKDLAGNLPFIVSIIGSSVFHLSGGGALDRHAGGALIRGAPGFTAKGHGDGGLASGAPGGGPGGGPPRLLEFIP